jgi:acetolactate synthase regulatory subunit
MSALRRRGVAIDTFNAKRLNGGEYEVNLRIDNVDFGSRSIETLVKQVANLVDVRTVFVVESESMPTIQ